MNIKRDLASNAIMAIKSGDYVEAAELLEAHLSDFPEDLGALLRLGLCRLLNRQEQLFVAIHRQSAILIRDAAAISEELKGLFALSETWFKKITAAALVVGTMCAACSDPVPPYGLGSNLPTDLDDGGPDTGDEE